LLSDLIRIDSVNPWLVPGGAGEGGIGDYVAHWLEPLGLEVKLDEVEEGRSNLIARLPGTDGGKSLCLYAHLDTVGYANWEDRALVPRVEGDRLYGLGAVDDKGHCAVAMLVLKSLVKRGVRLRGDLIVALLVDEEGTSSGTMHFVKHYNPDVAIIMDSPSGPLKVIVTHQGFGWLDIVVKGKAAHGCEPEIGVDAIAHMAEVIVRLQQLDREKFALAPHPLNGKVTFHMGTIVGGTDYATYPEWCKLGLEIGFQPGEIVDDYIAEIEDVLQEVKSTYPNFSGAVRLNIARPPFEAQGREGLWEVLSEEITNLYGQSPEAVGLNTWADTALFQEAGVSSLMISATGANLHSPDEWVSLTDLAKLKEIIEATVKRYCA
jgi:acetylornithine deacetylase/succinyl-diaminopimelate desuccinylase-like protein